MLEKAKHYPDSARERGAKGQAVISFSLDEKGKVTKLSLLQSSGETDLDVEALAVVDRASPFPEPPQGAQRDFGVVITFGLEKVEP
jgi:colicin import membrane protein